MSHAIFLRTQRLVIEFSGDPSLFYFNAEPARVQVKAGEANFSFDLEPCENKLFDLSGRVELIFDRPLDFVLTGDLRLLEFKSGWVAILNPIRLEVAGKEFDFLQGTSIDPELQEKGSVKISWIAAGDSARAAAA